VKSRELRRLFFAGLLSGLKVVWPILSGLLGVILALGIVIGLLEDWPLLDAIYFAFVSGLTIGYGDLVPTRPLSRVLAIGIGLTGVLLVGLIVAIGVRALERASKGHLVESGLDVREQEKKRFFEFADRLARSRDPEEQKRLKDDLARMTFGE
jgi:hypothetical protein